MKHERDNRATRVEFSAYLRAGREQKTLSLADISRITKVPTNSLQRLEDAEFDKLPADVFVRGFLRSYARCVGLDPEVVISKYADVRDVEPQPEPVVLVQDTQGEMSVSATADSGHRPIEVVSERPERTAASTRSRLHETKQFVARHLFDSDTFGKQEGSRRGAVTLAVIILVVVATLTMSYLLRRPSSSGDGVTHREQVIDLDREHTG